MTNYSEFRFNPATLATQRRPGISAYMRIKNEAEFVRIAIESHLPFYDEIVAVYNDCSDHTEAILRDLEKEYPHKLKVYHYLPKVHLLGSKEHTQTPDESVHGMANYSNYALSKTTYQVAVKLDADHLAIPQKLAPWIKTIRQDTAEKKQKVYYFSGLNLAHDDNNKMGVVGSNPFSGVGDMYYHQVNENLQFTNFETSEKLKIKNKKLLQRDYAGILYFHLKYLKKGFRDNVKSRDVVPFDEFRSRHYQKELKKQLNIKGRLYCTLFASELLQRVKYKLSGKPPRLGLVRLAQLIKDLEGIDLKRDVLDRLE